MNLLVVNWQDRENPNAGGAETHLHEIFGRLAAGGDEVTLLCSAFPRGAPRAELDGIDVHRVGGRHTFALSARRYFRAHLADRPFDVVVEDLNKIPLFTPRWTRLPLVLLVHHLFGRTAFQEAALPVAAATWLLERPLARAYAGVPVIAVSRSTEADLVARGFAPERIEVIPNGLDAARLTPDPTGERFDEPTLLYLGRLRRYKRVDLIIDAVARLRSAPDAPRLLVAGQGPNREALEARVRRLGLESRVRFLGYVSEAEKLDLLRRSWIHVLTSPREGWGIANLEAAACGTPTVASDAPGLRDSVIDGRTGVLVPHGDREALASALASLLADPARREEMGRAARAFAERFSWNDAARRIRESLVRATLAAPGGRQ